MADEYTPTTLAQIRSRYADAAYTGNGQDRRLAEFDAALAAHDAETRRKALEEAHDLVLRQTPEMGPHVNATPYRDGLTAGVGRALDTIRALAQGGETA